MKKIAATLSITVLLVTMTCSLAHAAPGDIWLAGYLLLTLKSPAQENVFQQRVDTVQERANNLLALSNDIPMVDVKKCRGTVSIYAGNNIFLTVTPDDARSSGKSVDKLACYWAQRLRTILPDATPIKH